MTQRFRRSAPLLGLLIAPLAIYFGAILRRTPVKTPERSPLSVTVINVGQGECSLIRTPGGGTVLIGTGGNDVSVSDAVMQTLQNAGVKRIDLLILPYPYAEAIGGVRTIYESFSVQTVLEPGGEPLNAFIADARTLGRDYKTDWQQAPAGDPFAFLGDDVSVEILSPPVPRTSRSAPDNSLIVAVRYGRTRFLFAGGMEAAGERRLLAAPLDLQADFLRVARFGTDAASSPEFLRRVRPRFAVISVGANGDGYPGAKTVSRLQECGASVYRTDSNGGQSLTFFSDGQDITQGSGGGTAK